MGGLFILNFVLVAIPIGATLGVLLGLDSHRAATGQDPLFKPEHPNMPIPGDNGIKIIYHCNETVGIAPPSQGDQYTFNPNPWGWEKGDEGSICMNVTTWNNQTYPHKTSAPEFSVTWQFPPGDKDQPVHAFPNVKLDSGELPRKIKDLDMMKLDFEWTYAVGNSTAASTTDKDELALGDVNTNVALDMFLDSDKKKAGLSDGAAIEIMVWFATIGPATVAIGNTTSDSILDTVELNGTTFSLYSGVNGEDQFVHTWCAEETADKFHADLMPLVERLVEMDRSGFPSANDYIGYMSLGTEAYFSGEVVTFHVPELSIDIEVK